MLTELTLLLLQWTRQLAELCPPIEIHNGQVTLRLCTDVTNHVLADEKAIRLNTINGTSKSWADCVAVVVDLESSGFELLSHDS